MLEYVSGQSHKEREMLYLEGLYMYWSTELLLCGLCCVAYVSFVLQVASMKWTECVSACVSSGMGAYIICLSPLPQGKSAFVIAPNIIVNSVYLLALNHGLHCAPG